MSVIDLYVYQRSQLVISETEVNKIYVYYFHRKIRNIMRNILSTQEALSPYIFWKEIE